MTRPIRMLLLVLGLALPAVALAQPAPPPSAVKDPQQARQACVDAMNADPMFANSIIKIANEQTAETHMRAANAVAKNEHHVILAYAAMWVVAALFVIFLWRRQQALNAEIAALRRDLDAATKEGK